MDEQNLPKHIAIIMDGNRRWARAKGLPVKLGHREGAKTLEKIVRYANKIGIKYITVYAFSTENWKRTEEEVSALMGLFQSYLDDYSKRADSENIKVKIIGNRQPTRCSHRNTIAFFNYCNLFGYSGDWHFLSSESIQFHEINRHRKSLSCP